MSAARAIRRTILAGFGLALAAGIGAPASAAETYPSRPVRLILPYGSGSLADTVPRAIQDSLERRFGQRVLVENKPGAGGNVGVQQVVTAPPDGYTLGLVATNNLVINQFLFAKMPFDPLKDVIPVTLIAEVPIMLFVNPTVPAHNLREFIDYARAHPGQLNYGSPSVGTIPHLSAEIFAHEAKVKLVHIPYKGGAPALAGILSNEVQAMFIGFATASGPLLAGNLRPIAVASPTRLAVLPNMPTFAEAGFPDLAKEMPSNWWGLVAPKGTDPEIVQRWAREIRGALGEPEAKRRYSDVGLVPVGSTPAEFAAGLPAQAQKWSGIIRQLGIKAE